mgnify:CR=1 FL=1
MSLASSKKPLPSPREPRALQTLLGVHFNDLGLLGRALVHRSYLNENSGERSQSNERLEYLGDAVIDLVVANHLYNAAPHASEGELTLKRTQVVRGESLAGVARRLGLGRYLFMGHGEIELGGEDRDSNLADVFESVVGAVFLDQGYQVACGLVERVLAIELGGVLRAGVRKDPKSVLQELLQANGLPLPRYRVAATTGPDQAKEFTVEVLVDGSVAGIGSGLRKLEAERSAAGVAIEYYTRLKGIDVI